MIKIYNTLTGKNEEFKTIEENNVRMYVCGPTVYNNIHIGNARPVIFFDTVRRYLEYKGYKVKYVQNFTDIDDKIINKANEEGIEIAELTDKYIKAFFDDTKSLNIKESGTTRPKATEYIEEMIAFVKELEKKGAAYVSEGDVYFDIEKFKGYGKLSRKNLEDLNAGSRVEISSKKKNPADFVLWKSAKPGEPKWDSPWGAGRPGWHLECSVMSMNELGETIDIHGGGEDLMFPHHENEIAQSEAHSGKNFVNYWMHNGFLNIKGEKMSKSANNFFLLKDILSKYDGRAVRFFMLSSHYRKPIDFSEEEMLMAKTAVERIENTLKRCMEKLTEKDEEENDGDKVINEALVRLNEKFEDGMNDDFNTAIALASVFEFIKEINIFIDKYKLNSISKKTLEKAVEIIKKLVTDVLGINLQTEVELGSNLTKELIDFIVELRWNAKQDKNWALADVIRKRLAEMGVKIEDKKDKTTWSL